MNPTLEAKLRIELDGVWALYHAEKAANESLRKQLEIKPKSRIKLLEDRVAELENKLIKVEETLNVL